MSEPQTDQIHRLAALFQPYQLQELLEVCEAANAAGKGWYTVMLTFKAGSLDEIDSRFTRKPRLDQSALLKR